MDKKIGQTANEYLLTYGWAIIIILVAAGVLAYYGIFALRAFLECPNCFNETGNCYKNGCICNDSTMYINPNLICGYAERHYVIP